MGQVPSLLASPSLFPDAFISEKIRSALPEGFSLRPLRRADFDNGHCDVLPFASVSEISRTQWLRRYEEMRRCKGTYHVVVIVDKNGKIQGTGTLMVERKFLFDLGIQGHIEDVSIAPDQQGKKFGQLLIQALTEIGEKVGCYKTILDCREAKEGFYLKCGYERRGLEMHHYHQAEAQQHSV